MGFLWVWSLFSLTDSLYFQLKERLLAPRLLFGLQVALWVTISLSIDFLVVVFVIFQLLFKALQHL